MRKRLTIRILCIASLLLAIGVPAIWHGSTPAVNRSGLEVSGTMTQAQVAHVAPAVFAAADTSETTATLPALKEQGEQEAPAEDDEEPVAKAPIGEIEGLRSQDWDASEYKSLMAGVDGSTDMLSLAPIGQMIAPDTALTLDEVLSANRPEMGITYLPTGTPGKAPALRRGQIELESPQYLDFDDEHKMIYGRGRVTARYGSFKLVADRMAIDVRLKEIQAYGNVVLTGDQEFVEAESMWVNAETHQGAAFNTRGRTGTFYFLGDPDCQGGRTTFRQLSQDESHLKEASFTTCDFPVPHYRFHAKEFTIMTNDRIFARNVVLYIRETPVMWLPYLTRAMKEDNPWGFTVGSDSQLGFFVRVWYDYYHTCRTPSDVDDAILVKGTEGRARLFSDFFSDRGFGTGLKYSYYLDRGRHQGDMTLYQISDSERDVAGEESTSRYIADWWNRTKITDQVHFLSDIDYMSDPDIYYDIFDRLAQSGDEKRRRLSERRAQAGFEWSSDDFFAGLQVEIKERVGRDRVSNFQDPRDGDRDFDRKYNSESFFTITDPSLHPNDPYDLPGIYTNPLSVDEDLDNGLSRKRYGKVTERLPQLTISSTRQRLWCLPLWYHVDLNVFNNLDKGLNIVGTGDDSFVHGLDLYQSISHLLKFCERYTLLTKVGLGVGSAQRADDSYNLDFPDGATFPFVYDGQVFGSKAEGLTFIDKDTFLIGKREMSLKNVDPFFVYGDIDSRFNARISDSLTAWARYRLREGSQDSLGEFYESIGSRKVKDDLYPFRTNEHWIEAGVNQNFLIPRLNWSASVGRNLQGESDIYPHELLQYSNVGVGWANLCNTLSINTGVSLQQRQMRDPTDPNQFLLDSTTYYISGSYSPIHRRYWTRLSAFFIQNNDQDPLDTTGDGNDGHAFDTRDETVADWTLGKKIGSKYVVQYKTRMRQNNGDTEQWLKLERDFHDMVAGLQFGMENNKLSDEEETTQQDNFQVRFNVRFKPAYDKGAVPQKRTQDVYSSRKIGAYESGL